MIRGSLAKRYARALMAIGQEMGIYERLGRELDQVAAIAREDETLRMVIKTPIVGKDVRERVMEGICQALVRGGHVEIRGLGSFKTKTRKARQARNPRTGEAVFVPEKVVPYFKASKELRAKVMGSQEPPSTPDSTSAF